MRKPDFDNILAVLANTKPERPTLFEFAINKPQRFFGSHRNVVDEDDPLAVFRALIYVFHRLGYDYVPIPSWETNTLSFPTSGFTQKDTRSLNEGANIFDKKSLRSYPFPDPDAGDYSIFQTLSKELPDGMKFICNGNGGILENAINLVGYENLCIMLFEDENLVQKIFDAIGSRYVRYYEICARIDCIGACISNDDWGFKTQTILSPAMLRKYVFPWQRKIVEVVHKAGKPAILHSCGNLEKVMDDVIDDMKFDAKHSFEDSIVPVEQAYERWGDRIAILGGIDIDYLCSRSPEEIYERSHTMILKTKNRGGYALGSGNSIPEYVPAENYQAMLSAAVED
ncbi:uroporphyrinogen-III decarboxylase-like protein [candidate division KSB1 bacterium]|nr:uroporphyrinogen-III decarboxylase-like protein [candidate division KSB1 bacterium]